MSAHAKNMAMNIGYVISNCHVIAMIECTCQKCYKKMVSLNRDQVTGPDLGLVSDFMMLHLESMVV